MRIGLRFSLPLAALFFTAPAAAAQLTLVWTDRSNNEDGFRIERRTSGGSFAQIAVVAANVTSFVDSNVTAGTTYCYRVRAHNRQRVSAYTNEACGAPASLPSVAIGASAATATEGGGAGQFLVRRTGSTAAPLTVSYTVGGTATAGLDYAALSPTVVIPAGASSAAITVRPTNDTAVEPQETVVVRLNASTAYTVGAASSAAVRIVSDDKPSVAIGASAATATEGGGAGQFLVRRTGSTAAPLTVSYTVGGTATAGLDYAALSPTVVIPAGASSAAITVRPTNDTAVEPQETVVVRLNASTAYTVGAASSAAVRIVSDDKPSVAIGASAATATEGGGAGQFLVRRTGSTAAPLTVSYTVGGTATAGLDYAALSPTVVIPAGASSAAITVRPTNDTAVEPQETVVVRLNASTAYTVGAASSAAVRIVSDDKPSVAIGASAATATEGGGAGQFLVRRTGSTAAPLTVSYTVGGTATAGLDYAALSPTVVIPAGASSAAITVRPTNDTAVEPQETVVVRLNASTAYTVGAASSAAVRIVSDDKPSVAIGASAATATEGGGAGQFLVRRTGSTAAPLTVSYTVGGTATAGLDYAALSPTVVIPAGASSAAITVRPTNDTAVEPQETVVVRLNASTAYTVGAASSAAVRIVSDDKPSVAIGASAATATEGGGAGQFLVRRTGSTAAPLTVSYTVGGTATAGLDYAALSPTVVIPAGASSAAITVRPTNDTAVEPQETVVVRLNASTAYTVGAASSAAVRIVSDDKPSVAIGASAATATEGGGAGQFLVRRTGSTAAPLTVSYTVGGTATAGLDYAALSPTVVIPAGASSAAITVRPTNDTAVEPQETVVVRLNASTAYTVGAASSAAVRIVSDDKPSVAIGASAATATEGGGAGQFLVRRTGSTAAPLTVSYTVGGTATAGLDYAALSPTVVIPAGASSAAITVRPTNDTAVEPQETVVVRLNASTAYTVGAASSAAVRIVSDDVVPSITIDNGQTGTSFTGTWLVSSGPNRYGSTSLYAAGSGQDTYRWTPTIPTMRVYEVHGWWTSLPSRSMAVEYRIRHAGGTAVVARNQRTAGGQWVYLGAFQFNAGTAGYVQVSDVNGAGVSADAIRLVPGAARPGPSQIPPGGIVIDNGQSGTSFTGQWSLSKGSNPYGARSVYAAGSGQGTYRWRPTIPSARPYDVYVWWTVDPNRSTNVQYRIVSALGTAMTTRDQRTGGGRWQYLGTFQFNAGTGGYVQVSDINGSTVCADAVLFVPR